MNLFIIGAIIILIISFVIALVSLIREQKVENGFSLNQNTQKLVNDERIVTKAEEVRKVEIEESPESNFNQSPNVEFNPPVNKTSHTDVAVNEEREPFPWEQKEKLVQDLANKINAEASLNKDLPQDQPTQLEGEISLKDILNKKS